MVGPTGRATKCKLVTVWSSAPGPGVPGARYVRAGVEAERVYGHPREL